MSEYFETRVDDMQPGRFIDRVAFSMLFRLLQSVSAEDVRTLIQEGTNLWDGVSAQDWQGWGNRIRRLKLGQYITSERFKLEFQKRRPDIYQVYLDEPLAAEWLDHQVALLKSYLQIEDPAPPRFFRMR